MHDLLADGNSIVLVDHDVQVLREAGWLIEMGPGAGAKGGTLLAQGTVAAIESNAASRIGPYLAGRAAPARASRAGKDEMFAFGRIHLSTLAIHTLTSSPPKDGDSLLSPYAFSGAWGSLRMGSCC